MSNEATGRWGAVSAPHHAATDAGAAILRAGGNAIEAAVGMAAVTAVVYPHMSGLGGDGFWLIDTPHRSPVGIDAGGPAAEAATPAWYTDAGAQAIPARGPLAALTVPGAVAGWQTALAQAPRRLPEHELLAPAIDHARRGWKVTTSQAWAAERAWPELAQQPGFTSSFGNTPPTAGREARHGALAATLEQLAVAGLDDFYRGELARALAADLALIGSPLAWRDLAAYRARRVPPLRLRVSRGTFYNLPPPTQGALSLIILGIFDRLGVASADGFAHIHTLIEATKLAERARASCFGEPETARAAVAAFLDDAALADGSTRVSPEYASALPANPGDAGDTVWLGATDAEGRTVSALQSIYWGFGSGCASPDTGILLQNRGHSFDLPGSGPNPLAPGRYPLHTLNPALAHLDDGRVVAYGSMGGDGQPQFQAALITRYAWSGQALAQAVGAPRWLLGRRWGESFAGLRAEAGLGDDVLASLQAAGHRPSRVSDCNELMGHAGGVVRDPQAGTLSAASDPRSDGAAAAL